MTERIADVLTYQAGLSIEVMTKLWSTYWVWLSYRSHDCGEVYLLGGGIFWKP